LDAQLVMALMANNTTTSEVAVWQDRLAVVSRNLAEINELPALLRIKARLRAKPDAYAGETQTRIADALAALDVMWKDYLLLNALIDEADALHRQSSLFHDRAAEIRELLNGPSITMPVAHVPLAERSLLTSAERADKATPDELLAAMNAIFTITKDTILDLDGAEKRLPPRIAAISDEARGLSARAEALGEAGAGDILAIAARIEALGAETAADPLGAGRKLEETGSLLADWRTRLDAAERERYALGAALVDARQALQALEQLAAQTQAAHADSLAKIADHGTLPSPTESSVIAQFGAWLDQIETKHGSGDWRPAKAGLDRWVAACAAHQATERAILAANRAPLEARDELRGRLKALHAKADAHAARGVRFEENAMQLAERAKAILYSQPADLKQAADALAAYEAAINRAINRG
jgi:hypothetical protein